MPAFLPASVHVRGLVKRYGKVEALCGISFDVAAGEIFGILGANGAGKTTALECIMGLRRPDSGSVFVAGMDVLDHPEETKRVIGAVLQAATLQDRVTPRKVLRLFSSFCDHAADTGSLIERFGLTAKADSPFVSLSGGQRQRLFLALAFVNNPSLVVLDEPTAGLDPGSRRELHEIIVGMRTAGRTVVMCTHDLEEAQSLCDRVAILDRGEVIASGQPSALVAGSRLPSTVEVRTSQPLTESQVKALSGITHWRWKDGGWLIGTDNTDETVVDLVKVVEVHGNKFIELLIRRASLEDVFLSITGRAWLTEEERK